MSKGLKTAGRYSGILMIAFLFLSIVSPAFLMGASGVPDVSRADDMIVGISIDHDSVYNTSAGEQLGVSYTITGDLMVSILHGEKVINSVGIDLFSRDDIRRSQTVYTWNHTPHESVPDDPMYFRLPSGLTAGDYAVSANFTIMNISAHPYQNVSEVETSALTLEDGTGFYRMTGYEPEEVDNGGSATVTLTYGSNREITDGYTMHLGLFNNDLGTWEVPRVSDPLGNVSYDRVTGNSVITISMGIAADLPTGLYSVRTVLIDPWGYSEIVNETAFTVIPEPLPPVLVNDTIYLMEDVPVAIDLNDHISDPNGDELTFWSDPVSNASISVEFINSSAVLFTPAPDWFGVEAVLIWADDGAGHNVSFPINISVESVEDLPRPAEDRTYHVDENGRYLKFDPQSLFVDPDIGDEFEVSLGWKWSEPSNGTPEKVRLYYWTDGTFRVSLITLEGWNASIRILGDLEEGHAEFPITAWVDEDTYVNSTAWIEVGQVNDPPIALIDVFTGVLNQELFVDLSGVFVDPDNSSDELSFSIEGVGYGINATLEEGSGNLTIYPDHAWSGSSWITIAATDGVDITVHSFFVVIPETGYVVSGIVTYENASVHLVDISDWELMAEISFTTVTDMFHVSVDPENGTFSIELNGGDYTMFIGLNLDWSRYYVPGTTSGYEAPDFFDITVAGDMPIEIIIPWIEVEDTTAVWSDIDFESHTITSNDEEVVVFVPVFDPSLDGYDDIVVNFVIGEGEDELVFLMAWDPVTSGYHLRIDDDELEEIDDHEEDYFFADETGENRSSTFQHEFDDDEDDEKLGILGVLFLLFLLFVGVIAALIIAFITGVILALILIAVGLVLLAGLIIISLIIAVVIGLVLILIPILLLIALIIGAVGLFLFIGLILSIVAVLGVLLFVVVLLPILILLILGGLLLAVLIPIGLVLLLIVGTIITVILAVVVSIIIAVVAAVALLAAVVLIFVLGVLFFILVLAIALPIIVIVEIIRAMRRRKTETFEFEE